MTDQVVLITGAAPAGSARKSRAPCNAAGANVLIHHRSSAAAAAALAQEFNEARPHSAAVHAANLAEVQAPEQLVAATLREFGRLDILINNASSFYPTPVGRITLAQWDDLMGSNLKAPLFLSQAATPACAPGADSSSTWSISMRCGRSRTILSTAPPRRDWHVDPVAGGSLARELGPEIRVNGIAPGPVLWPEGDMDDALKREIIDKTALKRHGTPQDIARTALFLAKDAPYITGQIIAVDGGRSI